MIFVRSMIEFMILGFGTFVFFAKPKQMWFIFLHYFHLLNSVFGFFSWVFIRFNVFVDVIQEFPIEK